MPTKPTTIDEYLARVTPEQRAALEKIRKAIRAAAPRAEEYIGYGLAAFRLDGKPLVAFGATAKHCAFYPMSSSTVGECEAELAGYDTSTGTIRFSADKPLPAALVKKLVKARIAENAAPKGESQTDPAVDEFIRNVDHPRKAELELLRRLILGASPVIREGIKWNSPSFRTTDWFATINLAGKADLRLILHTGAKVKASATDGVPVADPTGLLKWLAKDRALVTLGDRKDIESKRKALVAVLREWVSKGV